MTETPASVLVSANSFLTRKGISALVDSLPNYKALETQAEGVFEAVMSLDPTPKLLIIELKEPSSSLLKDLGNIATTSATDILLILHSIEKVAVEKMLKQGIKGIVTQYCSEEEIVNAIQTSAKGEKFLCSKVIDVLINGGAEQKAPTPSAQSLSPREKEVLTLITQGHTTIEIADKLHVSVHTINSHRKNMLKKFNLKSPIELIVYAIEHELVEK